MKKLSIILISLLLVFSCAKEPSLWKAYEDAFYIGVALNRDQISGKDRVALDILKEHFNSITPENILKWSEVHPVPDSFNFSPADAFVRLGEENNMFIVGHTLVWHYQTPQWVFKDDNGNPVSKDVLIKRMKDHIFKVVGRYKGRIHGWDVVNEAINDDGSYRQSPWLKIIGEEYIELAFEFAHEADPDAELYYNDFNMWKPGKREGVIRLLKRLQSKGIQIDGIGMQGHWGLDYPEILEDIEASIKAFSDLGVKIMITELDVTVLPFPDPELIGADITKVYDLRAELNPYAEGLPDSMQKILADRYREFFEVFLKHKDKISRVTLWGMQDGQSFRNFWPIRGRADYPLLFDRNYMPKPAFYAVLEVAKINK
ncbi:MAG: endo-1,4-beta-xylanase [Candidatus Marinimicrobia bacterium]|nr:endo-1,4-beta-xylanase [Candidatus Neomarinimicrobiota bacterium]